VIDLQYIKTDLGGGTYQYDFKLILTNADNSYVAGQGWNFIVFGDVPMGTSTLNDFTLLSESFVNPNMSLGNSSGAHNGPTFLDVVNPTTGGWIPSHVGDFVTWSGTSSNNVADGTLLFSTLISINGANAADFQVANAVPEPNSLCLVTAVVFSLCMNRRLRT
jgi:hypothetical protein